MGALTDSSAPAPLFRRWFRGRTRPRIGRPTLLVVLAVLALTVSGFLTARARVAEEERVRLESEIAELEQFSIEGVAAVRVLMDRAAGALQSPDGQHLRAFEAALTPDVLASDIVRGVAAVRVDGERVVPESVIGSVDDLSALRPELVGAGTTTRATDSLRLYSYGLSAQADRSIVHLALPVSRGDEAWVVAAEVGFSVASAQVVPAGLDMSIVLGSGPDAGAQMLMTAEDGTIEEPRQTAAVQIGGDTWLFTVGGASPLGLSRHIPWGVLAVGLLLTGSTGYLTEVARRRQARAFDLSEQNAALDIALRDLNRSEEQFRGVVDAAPEALFLVDRDEDTATPLNDAAASLLEPGGTREALWELMHPDDAATIREQARDLLITDQRRVIGLETRVRARDGVYHWMQVRMVVQGRHADGQPSAILVTASDISPLVEAKRAAEASAAQMRAVWNSARSGLLVQDDTFHTVNANPAFLRLIRAHSLEEVIGKDLGEMLAPPEVSIEEIRANVVRYAEADEPSPPALLRCYRLDGTEAWLEVATAFFPNMQGRAFRVISVNDVTERERLTRQLQQTAEEVSAVLESAPYPLLILGVDGRISMSNAQATTTFGLERTELDGREIGELLDPEFRRKQSAGVEVLPALAGATELDPRTQRYLLDSRVRVICRRRDGTPFPAELMVSVIPGSNVRRRYVATLIDQTEHEQMEARLLQVQKHEALATVVAGVAHDFNNLLTAIGGSLQLLEREVGPENRWLSNAIESGERAGSLVRELLQFSRRDAPQRVAVNLHELTENVVELARETFDRRITVDCSCVPGVSYMVFADPAQIEQVVLNLLTNARDAVLRDIERADPAGRPTPRITVSLGRVSGPEEAVELTVRDNGHGVAPDVAERIFDPFFTTKPPGKGTGMGLASAYGVITAHDGTIDLQSRPGEGATFRVRLPTRSILRAVKSEADGAPAQAKGAQDLDILVAEDEMQVLEFVVEVLTEAGHRVTAVTDGEAAIRRALADRFDVVVLDINMPGRNGWEALREIRRRPDAPPVVLCSGHAHGDDARARGAAAMLSKPFSQRALLDAVSEAHARAGRPAVTAD